MSGVLTGKGLHLRRLAGPHRGHRLRPRLLRRGDAERRRATRFDGQDAWSSPAPATWPSTPPRRPQQLGAKVVAMSDSTGWIYDEDGIDLDARQADQGSASAAASRNTPSARPGREYHEGRGIWNVPCDIALPCATQNELHARGRQGRSISQRRASLVAEGANMPTTLEATELPPGQRRALRARQGCQRRRRGHLRRWR